MDEVVGVLRTGARMLTLTGAGGSGKTRLALQAATEVLADHADGVFYVPLATITDPATLAMEVVEKARRRRDEDPEAAVRRELQALLVDREPGWSPRPSASGGPAVILVVGVNGTGKTTTIGKLAARYKAEGRRVVLAAADTFRAAAIDQLRIWADRADVEIVAHKPDADPGAVVYDALDAAVARGADLVIADTAGRLHTKVEPDGGARRRSAGSSTSACRAPSPRRSS